MLTEGMINVRVTINVVSPELRAVGLSPDLIICRSSDRVELSTREKISVFCDVAPSHVMSVHDVSNIYHVPLILAEQGLHTILRYKLILL